MLSLSVVHNMLYLERFCGSMFETGDVVVRLFDVEL